MTAIWCGDPTCIAPKFGSPKIAPMAKCTTHMSKLDISRDPKFWAIHVGSQHHIAVTGYNILILVNNCKTEFHSFSYNYNSKAFWQKKVFPKQRILMSQGISSFCSAGGQGSELNNNLFPPCKVLLMNFCKHWSRHNNNNTPDNNNDGCITCNNNGCNNNNSCNANSTPSET